MPSGDLAVLRYRKRGRVAGALPTRQIADLTLWLAPETACHWGAVNGRHVREVGLEERFTGEWGSVPHTWEGAGVVIRSHPGRAHSVWHFFQGDVFAGWYVNLEAPWTPIALGFETEDHELDIWIEPDGTWRWKDEEDLAAAVELGFYSREEADAIRAEGERVLEAWPFPTGWEDWRPDPAWSVPELPEGWDRVD